jgi:hypothetical protein
MKDLAGDKQVRQVFDREGWSPVHSSTLSLLYSMILFLCIIDIVYAWLSAGLERQRQTAMLGHRSA